MLKAYGNFVYDGGNFFKCCYVAVGGVGAVGDDDAAAVLDGDALAT